MGLLEGPRTETHLQLKMCLLQEIHVEDVRVLVYGPQEDLHLHQVHHHPVSREDVPHQVFKHVERLHQEVLEKTVPSVQLKTNILPFKFIRIVKQGT